MSTQTDVQIADYTTQWQPRAYLTEYYGEVQPDERFAMEFLIESLRRVAPVSVALEFGCGPTVHHALPLIPIAAEIHLAEYLSNNRDEVQSWLNHDADAFNWRHFTTETLELEGHQTFVDEDVREREAQLRERVTQVIAGDAFAPDPLGLEKRGFYPLVTSHYCAEACTTDKAEWRACMTTSRV
jgi:hypothetical protein